MWQVWLLFGLEFIAGGAEIILILWHLWHSIFDPLKSLCCLFAPIDPNYQRNMASGET